MTQSTGEILADRIRRGREWSKLTQDALADQIPVTKRTLVRYEKGETEPDNYVLKEIARATGVRYEWLRTGEGEMKSPPTRPEAEPRGFVGEPVVGFRQRSGATDAEGAAGIDVKTIDSYGRADLMDIVIVADGVELRRIRVTSHDVPTQSPFHEVTVELGARREDVGRVD